MKIALLSPQYYPTIGGVPALVDLLGRAFERAGHDVTVATSEAPPNAGEGGAFVPVAGPQLAELLRVLRGADAVVSLQECLSLTWPLALGLVRPRVLVFLQMHPPAARGLRAWPARMLRRKLFRAARLCACSNDVAIAVQRSHGVPVQAVHNPYDCEVFRSTGDEVRDIDVLYVGRLAIHKRCDVLIDAVALCEGEGASLSMVIAGDGPEATDLKARAARLGNCRFVGPVSAGEGAALMRRARVMVVPSGYEPFGIVVLEGLACGCRLVTSDVGGLPEAGNGFAVTFRVNDPADLARRLQDVWVRPAQGPSVNPRLAEYLRGQRPDAVAARILAALASS